MEIKFRRFIEEDAKTISKLIRRNFMEVNIKDYDEHEMTQLYDLYDEDKVKAVAAYAHMYVALYDEQIVGTGSISSFWGNLEESILLSIFVLPDLQGKGIGKAIMETLELDEFFLRAKRIEIPASITACEFYKKFGYDYKNGICELDDEKLYRLEKIRS